MTSNNCKQYVVFTGEKQKRLMSYISESDKDIPPRKQKYHTLSSDSDSESYDTSSRCGKEPASGRAYKKKKMFHIKKEYHINIKVQSDICNEDTLLIHCHVLL